MSPAVSSPPPQHSILPLAVLEAMRNLDSPGDEDVAEYVDELLKKRLGISATVAAQIGRYEAAVARDELLSGEELEQIFRLASRRTDAALVFSEAGRRAARRALGRLSAAGRWAARSLPRPLGRYVGFRLVRRSAQEVFGASFVKDGGTAVAALAGGVPTRATPDGASCAFYAAAFAELLRQLIEFDGSMSHSRCRARGDEHCEWRTKESLEERR